jgi:uncharacterized membrane protein
MTRRPAAVSRAFKQVVVVVALLSAFFVLSADVASAACSYFGCSPEQGNPIRELAGMIVTMAVIAGLLYGAAKRYVK